MVKSSDLDVMGVRVMATQLLEGREAEERRELSGTSLNRIVRLGRALSDPVRVRMLTLIAAGRRCCPPLGAEPPVNDGDEGLCVCEISAYFRLGQSRVSYHLKQLKEAGIVREERRGKWTFYSLDRGALAELLRLMEQLQAGREIEGLSGLPSRLQGGVDACCRANG